MQVFSATTGAFVRKLQKPLPLTGGGQFGTACALSGNLALIGMPTTTAPLQAVFVYDLTTGKLVRTLKPNPLDIADADRFGVAIAVSGSKVLIGANGDNADVGSAYVFNLTTGAQLAKLAVAGVVTPDQFGRCVAAEGNLGIVGARGANSNRGAAYVFDLTTYAQIRKIQPTASVAGDLVGTTVAITQGKVVMSAPGANTNRGKVFTMDLFSLAEQTFTASDGGPNEVLGTGLAADQGLIIAGALAFDSFRGRAYVFDTNAASGTEMRILPAPDTLVGGFGNAIAMNGGKVVITAPTDDTQAADAGAAFLIRTITRPMPLTKVAARGDSAPGSVECTYNLLGETRMNSTGRILLASSLTGAGSNASHDNGMWSTLGASGLPDLVIKSRDTVSGAVKILSTSAPLANQSALSIFRATLSGTGVTSVNNQAIYSENGSVAALLWRTGTPEFGFNFASPATFLQVVQSRGASRVAYTTSLRIKVGTTAANDTGFLLWDVTSNTTYTIKESATSPAIGTPNLGQFTGRLAMYNNLAVLTTALTGGTPAVTSSNNQAIFRNTVASLNTLTTIAQKGGPAMDTAGVPIPLVTLSAFIGESIDDSDIALYRATISGTGITTANNEGLWTTTTAGVTKLTLRKGIDLAPALPGVRIAKFIRYWQTFQQTLALVQLTGTGVTSANDQALILYQTTSPVNGQVVVLMREGESAASCGTATIGTISRVEVEPYYGHYYVLATLAGAPVGTELALFRGYTHLVLANTSEQTMRRPSPMLRKGQLFDNQPSTVKSISLPLTNFTAAGAGTTGLGSCVQEANTNNTPTPIAITIEFNNGVRQVMKGTP